MTDTTDDEGTALWGAAYAILYQKAIAMLGSYDTDVQQSVSYVSVAFKRVYMGGVTGT